MISIRMLKLCDESFCKSLNIFFNPCPTPKPQSPLKKRQIDKQRIKNYRPVLSFRPIRSKAFERIIY